MGNARDPPNISMCMHQLNNCGEPKKDSLGLFLRQSARGSSLTELCSEILAPAHRTWKIGAEFSDCTFIERNNCRNQITSEAKRGNCPNFEHFYL